MSKQPVSSFLLPDRPAVTRIRQARVRVRRHGGRAMPSAEMAEALVAAG